MQIVQKPVSLGELSEKEVDVRPLGDLGINRRIIADARTDPETGSWTNHRLTGHYWLINNRNIQETL